MAVCGVERQEPLPGDNPSPPLVGFLSAHSGLLKDLDSPEGFSDLLRGHLGQDGIHAAGVHGGRIRRETSPDLDCVVASQQGRLTT